MTQKQIYIITGGPGFGKTKLIAELRNKGYRCSDEFARDLIEEQLNSAGELLPWKNPKRFQEEVLKRRIAFFESVPDGSLAFSDRGIPDQLAFARYKGYDSPEILIQSASEHRYAPTVFVTPPWKEIFINDPIRTESYEESIIIHRRIVETYNDLNYQIIELPLKSSKKRLEFVLLSISKLT
jgi:predicted ATPase